MKQHVFLFLMLPSSDGLNLSPILSKELEVRSTKYHSVN